jgi:hypothetical protein
MRKSHSSIHLWAQISTCVLVLSGTAAMACAQTSVIWKDSSLFLSIEEHEDGQILRSKETWSLTENGAKQILFFGRQFKAACAGEP